MSKESQPEKTKKSSLDKTLDENIERLREEGWSEYKIERYIRGWHIIDKDEERKNRAPQEKKPRERSKKTKGGVKRKLT